MSKLYQPPLILLSERLAICRLNADAELPHWANSDDLLAFIRTQDELSVICSEQFVPPGVQSERGFRAFMVQGPLDFSVVGLLAAITEPLAISGISIFAISTYDTDYVLVKEAEISRARVVLIEAGFSVIDNEHLPT